VFERVRPGLLLHRSLGSDALYRVVSASGELVTVEVVQAPELESGTRLRFTRDAVSHMTVVEDKAAVARALAVAGAGPR